MGGPYTAITTLPGRRSSPVFATPAGEATEPASTAAVEPGVDPAGCNVAGGAAEADAASCPCDKPKIGENHDCHNASSMRQG
jgi:hypothetical protein